jgi:hypothetical protein
MVEDFIFEVVGRGKSEKLTNKGELQVTFKVSLKSTKGDMRLSIVSPDSDLLQKYPMDDSVPVTIGTGSQTTLVPKKKKEA